MIPKTIRLPFNGGVEVPVGDIVYLKHTKPELKITSKRVEEQLDQTPEVSFYRQLYNLAKAIARSVAAGIPVTDKREQERRLTICRDCEYFSPKRFKCNLCGCQLKWKIAMETEHCPVSKW